MFLFERTTKHLQIQKHTHQLELIIKECILNTIRESIPIEHLLKVYMEDQFIEEDTEVVDTEEIISQDPVVEEVEQQELEQEIEKEQQEQQELEQQQKDRDEELVSGVKQQTIKFDDIDRVRMLNDSEGEELINAPKTLERLEEISMKNFAKRKEQESSYGDDDDEDENDALHIGEAVSLGDLDIDVFSGEI